MEGRMSSAVVACAGSRPYSTSYRLPRRGKYKSKLLCTTSIVRSLHERKGIPGQKPGQFHCETQQWQVLKRYFRRLSRSKLVSYAEEQLMEKIYHGYSISPEFVQVFVQSST
jgi:hypothetical protein